LSFEDNRTGISGNGDFTKKPLDTDETIYVKKTG